MDHDLIEQTGVKTLPAEAGAEDPGVGTVSGA
jgi:hypothetical protein